MPVCVLHITILSTTTCTVLYCTVLSTVLLENISRHSYEFMSVLKHAEVCGALLADRQEMIMAIRSSLHVIYS